MIVRKIFTLIFIVAFPYSALAKSASKPTQFTIFSGDKKASFFAAASTICDVFNHHYGKKGYKCVAVESRGSESNLHSLVSKEADFAIIKTPELNRLFVKNFSEFENNIDFVARIHDEYLTILVQKKLKIKSLNDLNNRLVNIGSIGSTSALIVQKYFSDFHIQPKKTVNFSAAKSFEMMCNKKIDAWVYFIGHPNLGFKYSLEKCDVELVSLPTTEAKNFLKILPFLEKRTMSKELYYSLQQNIETISTQTILASRKGVNPKIKTLLQNVLTNYRDDLVEKNSLFNGL